jgi:perosamine synthetase
MQINKMILTAGPSITKKEISYVNDAIKNGHGEHWGDYIKKFEEKFAEYIGVKYSLATSSCTGALHLGLVALGIKKGDEVIVPDLTWIASASSVYYTGAIPVFADVCFDSWCLDVYKLKKLITSNTKAIMPVHLYGQPCDMSMISYFAKTNNLFLIEDAAPSVGASFHNMKTGKVGEVGCFSFQGAKMLSTEEGGMLVTNDSDIFEKVKHYSEHGRSGSGFDISDIGFKYKMTNLQAAMGLAQLERVDELIEQKKQIYLWYSEELKGIEGIQLNKKEDLVSKPIYWMTSIVLNKDFGVPKDVLMVQLKERNIDTRPFFPLLSSFRMFKKYDNPVAEQLSVNGINLPSGHNLTHTEVIYICDSIKSILKV